MNKFTITGEQARKKVLDALRKNGYQAKTSELAKLTKMPISITRRAALYLAAHHQLHAEIIAGRGKGEYLFKLTQLDLFEDVKPLPNLWQRIKSRLFS
jgi:response regulator of citrate/malate metabolism